MPRGFVSFERERNFAFVHNGGAVCQHFPRQRGALHDKEEWNRRHEQDMRWIETTFQIFKDRVNSAVIFSHAFPTTTLPSDLCIGAFPTAATAFAKPVLYLQGDGHKWLYDHPFANKSICIRCRSTWAAIAAADSGEDHR